MARCGQCGRELPWPSMCYEFDAPWRSCGVSPEEFEHRVALTADTCVLDNTHFMVRAHIELPVHGREEPFVWSVWCSLSERSFTHMLERWNDEDRANDPPMFGWLLTPLPCDTPVGPLKTMVHVRTPGFVPRVEAHPESEVGDEQLHGITLKRVEEFARCIGESGRAACGCDGH